MHTIILQSVPRMSGSAKSIRLEVLGDSPVKDAVKASIDALEHHPARAERRALIDMLGIIEKHNFRICHAERSMTEEDIESWLFILQG